MQHGMVSGPAGTGPGVNSSFSSIMDEAEDYMDYMGGGGGGSPLGLSSESSNQDRSCTSTPVGNDSSPAGEDIQKHVELQVQSKGRDKVRGRRHRTSSHTHLLHAETSYLSFHAFSTHVRHDSVV